jgi:urea transport system substrate-binding protein
MKTTRRGFSVGAAATVAATASPYIWSRKSGEAQAATLKKGEPIKVGVLFSLTGDLAVPEADSTYVLQYAFDEINKNGGIAGQQVQPVIIDAKSDFNVYSQKMKELILRDKVIAVFGCYTSASRKAVLPTVIQFDSLLYYPTCYEGAECVQNDICTGPLPNQHSRDLIPFMVKNFGKKVFFVGSNYVWPKESNKDAKVWLKGVDGELVGEEYVPLGGADFSGVLNKIRAANPDFIFSTVVGGSTLAFYTQFKQAGFSASSMPIETRAMGAEFGAGHFLSAPYFMALDTPTNHKFVNGFLGSPYNHGGVTHYNMEETYNSAYVFKLGLEKAIAQYGMENVTSQKLRNVSGGITLDESISPEGKVWIDSDNFNTWLTPKIGQCQSDGSFKIVAQSPTQIKPDPYFIYPDLGVCTAEGLKAPSGTIQKNVL